MEGKKPENDYLKGINSMKKLIIGILAHVDAGKTTLSEAMLYTAGSIRNLGRVDNKDAFLDTYALERQRGITIFSKQAQLNVGDMQITFLDTPGHVDFAAEMERTLQVLDYAILVISGADGVQGHTRTLWKLLEMYDIPTFLFINKMDQNGVDKANLMAGLKKRLDGACVDFSQKEEADFQEEIAVTDEEVLELFLEGGNITDAAVSRLAAERKVFPCHFGSALKLEGVSDFMQDLERYTCIKVYPPEFGAKVFKITRDQQGTRLTHLKVTGGSLKVKDRLTGAENRWEEKVNQIRVYSGEKYETIDVAEAGAVCAVAGLTMTCPGEGLGSEEESEKPVLEPVLSYRIILPAGCDAAVMLPRLRELEEEEPELHVIWNEELGEIQVQLMGEVQTEILRSIILDRFRIEVQFDAGNIIYKETIAETVLGVGHFEPLRHYAEVHVILEPLTAGRGLVFAVNCSEDVLDRGWQRLIMTHLQEKEHRGVLTGSAVTDMRITLAAGRGHNKHTEGGDFRQAAHRAVRQGLMEAEGILLEPYYEFRLEVPEGAAGRAIADIERMHGKFDGPHIEAGMAVLTGTAPVISLQDYHKEVIGYTKGNGRLFCNSAGYKPCHNAEEVISRSGYDALRDTENPTGSVFCAHGAGYSVPWDKVKAHMHVESRFVRREKPHEEERSADCGQFEERWLGTEEVDTIIDRTFNANKRSGKRQGYRKKTTGVYRPAVTKNYSKPEAKDEYLLVDGYNIIYAWDELKELAKDDIDAARGSLIDILCNYQGIKGGKLIVVFDAYRVPGGQTKTMKYHNIFVVYTKEAETADQYIERFAHQNQKKYNVTVATSDGMEQIIIRGAGCGLISARELKVEIETAGKHIQMEYAESQPGGNKHYLLDDQTDILTDSGN